MPENCATPYQSFVPIDGNTIAEVFEHHLTQSEQQPAALHTACSGSAAACLFLQKLPDADRKTRTAGTASPASPPPCATKLLGLPPTRSSPASSTRETVRLFDAREVTHHWPHDWDKVRNMLRSLGRGELDAMLAEHGEILIHDDLSNHEYRLGADEVAALFAENPPSPAPCIDPGPGLPENPSETGLYAVFVRAHPHPWPTQAFRAN